MLHTSSLHSRYGARVHGVDLSTITATDGYAEIRRAFEQHSLLYFADQELDAAAHLRLAELFGPREDRTIDPAIPDPAVSLVSNVKEGNELYELGETRLLDLQSNMLWHTDSTFLPSPALTNILVGRVIPPSGTATQFASTRVAWDDMPESLKNRVKGAYFRHQYSHSRAKIDAALAKEKRIAHWEQQIWKAIWTNPVNHREALYIASHACGIVGEEAEKGLGLIEELIEWCTQEKYVTTHQWKVGDVLIWDERAMLHRGVPWRYDEARILSSVCVSATSEDGLDQMRFHQDSRRADLQKTGRQPGNSD